ncbi:MAG: hypothetical protein QM770_22630 [Tepidisphaeraceae bacterium]
MTQDELDGGVGTRRNLSGAVGAAAVVQPPPLPMPGTKVVLKPADVPTQVALPQPEKMQHATALLTQIPKDVLVAARDPYLARAVALALLLDESNASNRATQTALVAQVDPVLVNDVVSIFASIQPLGPAARVPLLDLSSPALQTLTVSQLEGFQQLITAIARVDRMLSPFELALMKTVERLVQTSGKLYPKVLYTSVSAVAKEAAVMLSVLSRGGGDQQSARAYGAGAARLGINNFPPINPAADTIALSSALDTLRQASPGVQRRLVDAAAHCIAADGAVRIEEAELLRAVCAALGVPVPPYLKPA